MRAAGKSARIQEPEREFPGQAELRRCFFRLSIKNRALRKKKRTGLEIARTFRYCIFYGDHLARCVGSYTTRPWWAKFGIAFANHSQAVSEVHNRGCYAGVAGEFFPLLVLPDARSAGQGRLQFLVPTAWF